MEKYYVKKYVLVGKQPHKTNIPRMSEGCNETMDFLSLKLI